MMQLFHSIKKAFAALTAMMCTAIFLQGNFHSVTAYTFTPDISLHSEAAIVYSRTNQQILYEKNADKAEMTGHLAQIMTAIVVLEHCENLDGTTITADDTLYRPLYQYENADDLRYADIYNGDTLTVREYLYALLLTSSCEAALILSDHFGNGNSAAFVSMMNDKAAELGCTNTTFTNATGLYESQQTTTARDMLTIVNYALSLKDFEEIATTVEFSPSSKNPENHGDASHWKWTQANSMVLEDSDYYYSGASGIKTGNLTKSGRSIITQATRDGETYLVVLMNAPFTDEHDKLQFYHLEDAAKLLDWAFSTFSYVTLLEDDEEIAEVKVENSDGNSYVLVRPEKDCIVLWNSDVDTSAVQKTIHLTEDTMAPVKAGQPLGEIELKFSGEVIDTIPLVAVSKVERSFTKFNLYALRNFKNSPWFTIGIVIACILSGLYILLCIYASYRAKQSVIPEDPIHLVPHATNYHDRPQKNWKRSDTVFYHGPEADTEKEKKHEMSGAGRR